METNTLETSDGFDPSALYGPLDCVQAFPLGRRTVYVYPVTFDDMAHLAAEAVAAPKTIPTRVRIPKALADDPDGRAAFIRAETRLELQRLQVALVCRAEPRPDAEPVFPTNDPKALRRIRPGTAAEICRISDTLAGYGEHLGPGACLLIGALCRRLATLDHGATRLLEIGAEALRQRVLSAAVIEELDTLAGESPAG